MFSTADPFLGLKGKRKRKHDPHIRCHYPGLIFTHHSRASGVPGQKDQRGLQRHPIPPIEATSH